MKSIGIFEAKTKFASLCERVALSGTPVLVRKRGKPLVVITPVDPGIDEEKPDILTAWKEWKARAGRNDTDFPEVWKMRGKPKANPLAE